MDLRSNQAIQGSRGLRNNNPGNFRPGINWDGIVGEDDGYLVFSDALYGIRAMALNLYNNYYLFNKKNLLDFISKYAPSSDNNDPLQYAQIVGNEVGLGINEDMGLTPERTAAILRAMMNVELGHSYSAMISDADILEGVYMINKWQIAAIKTEGVILQVAHTIKDNLPTTILIITGATAVGVVVFFMIKDKKAA